MTPGEFVRAPLLGEHTDEVAAHGFAGCRARDDNSEKEQTDP
ncbi:hypothetical protein [Amycolatopsis palatopharyngis]|nr:hypothetical protein [Amycolatopsis palatopharyngis]